jgi:hypothetical protein
MTTTLDMSGDDPSLDGAVSRIMERFAKAEPSPTEDKRENKTDREAFEEREIGEMDVRDDAPESDAEAQQDAEPASDDGYIELLGDEGQEPERIPLSEVAEGYKQYRQMQGDIASAVIKAETEAEAKQAQILQSTLQKYQQTEAIATTAIKMLEAIMPALPSEELLNVNSEYYDPQGYYAAKARYDQALQFGQSIYGQLAAAGQGKQQTLTEADKAAIDRENARLARYIPDWGKDETREAKRSEIITALGAKYGVTADDMDGVVSHKAWRMMADLAATLKSERAAPEVRKAVQEKAVKLVKGKMPPRDSNGSGRFISEDAKALKDTGSEEAAARKWLRSGALKGL